MSRLLIVLIIISSLAACGGNSEIKEIIKNTSQLEIRALDTSGTVLNSKVITDAKEIRKVLSVVRNSDAPTFKCGHDFELYCKTTDNNFVTIEINSDDLCANASFLYNGQLLYRHLNKDKLENLRNSLN